MRNAEIDRPVRFSVLDRLLDNGEQAGAAGFSDELVLFREYVRRDLEWLLNTRRTFLTASDDYPELQRSLYHYGFPDVTSLGRDSPDTRARLVTRLEETIATFEPRLTNVRVLLQENAPNARRELRFVVHGMLQVDPVPLRVSFDTVLDRSSGDVAVRDSNG